VQRKKRRPVTFKMIRFPHACRTITLTIAHSLPTCTFHSFL
jgi:hypothetical protein